MEEKRLNKFVLVLLLFHICLGMYFTLMQHLTLISPLFGCWIRILLGWIVFWMLLGGISVRWIIRLGRGRGYYC